MDGGSLPSRKKNGSSNQKVRKSRYQSFVTLPNFTWFPYLAPDIFSGIVGRNLPDRNISKFVGRRPKLLFVIAKGSKHLSTAWTPYSFKTSFFHIVCWTEYFLTCTITLGTKYLWQGQNWFLFRVECSKFARFQIYFSYL